MKKGVKVSSGFKRNSRKVGGFNYPKSKVLSFLNLLKLIETSFAYCDFVWKNQIVHFLKSRIFCVKKTSSMMQIVVKD